MIWLFQIAWCTCICICEVQKKNSYTAIFVLLYMYLPIQMPSSSWRRTCHMSLHVTPQDKENSHFLLRETATLTSDLHVVRSCTLKPWQICLQGNIKQIFFHSLFYFWVGRYSKTLNDWPHGNFLMRFFVMPSNAKNVLPWGTLKVLGTYIVRDLSFPWASH